MRRVEKALVVCVGCESHYREYLENKKSDSVNRYCFVGSIEEAKGLEYHSLIDFRNAEKEIVVYYGDSFEGTQKFRFVHNFPSIEALLKHPLTSEVLTYTGMAEDTPPTFFYVGWLAFRLSRFLKGFSRPPWYFSTETMRVSRFEKDVFLESPELTAMEARIFSIIDSQCGSEISKDAATKILYGNKRDPYESLKPLLTPLRKKLSAVKMELISKGKTLRLVSVGSQEKS